MPYSALYFVKGRMLAQGTFQSPGTPHSLAYFCASCGEVWGRAVCPEATVWQCDIVPCEQHQPTGVLDWGAVPGSFLDIRLRQSELPLSLWLRAVEHLPPEVLQREFDLTLKWFERKEDGNESPQ